MFFMFDDPSVKLKGPVLPAIAINQSLARQLSLVVFACAGTGTRPIGQQVARQPESLRRSRGFFVKMGIG
jgi:hypothetical protein